MVVLCNISGIRDYKMVREETLQVVDKIPDANFIVEKVKKILEPYKENVKFAFLFGSYARGEADNWSDVDIGIYFAKDVDDDRRNDIRFRVMSILDPLEVQIGYLDNEDIAPVIFIAAADGIAIVMNDEDTYYEELIKNIHLVEEMKLIGIIE